MIQDILDHRSEFVCLKSQPSMPRRAIQPNGLGPRNGSLLFADFINQLLVPRLRRRLDPSDREYIQYQRLTKRQLKPAVQKKWKEIGVNVRSGFVMPDTDKVEAALREFIDIFHDWKKSNFEQADEFVADLLEIILDAQRP